MECINNTSDIPVLLSPPSFCQHDWPVVMLLNLVHIVETKKYMGITLDCWVDHVTYRIAKDNRINIRNKERSALQIVELFGILGILGSSPDLDILDSRYGIP